MDFKANFETFKIQSHYQVFCLVIIYVLKFKKPSILSPSKRLSNLEK